jgi:hypothetical protein
MAVQEGRSEPVSGGWEADFPVKQGKNREFSQIWGLGKGPYGHKPLLNRHFWTNSLRIITGKIRRRTGKMMSKTGNRERP